MTRYRAIIAYDGTDYHGFQRQAPEHEPTIQGEIEQALTKISQSGVTVLGSGRTDAGVHATGQVIAFNAEWRHSLKDLQRALNAMLPADIAVLDLDEAALDFHPRYDAVSREYVYTIYDAPVRHPLYRLNALHVAEPLDVGAMNAAAADLVGEHDFAAFGLPTAGDVTVRRMLRAECRADLPLVCLELEANGFLYRMVRSIVGTLLLVGRGEMTLEQFRAVMEARDRSRAGAPVPPQGLCLTRVNY
ncbi:MAG: truA [Chloroflexi bacterium]|nr:truA [Chloroflexota bacterium]